MQGANGSVFGCGLCRRTKGIGIWKLPVAKYEAHGKWRDEWLGKIKKTREMDQNFSEQSKSDAIYTCEKHFAPEDIEICKYMFVHLFSLNCRICFELGFHRFFDQCCCCLMFVLNVDMVLVLTNSRSVGNFILSLIDHPAKWLKRSPNLELCRSWICLRKVMKEASLTARPERSVVKCNEGPLPQLLQWIFRALPAS